ncbi:MAG TPA: transposase [Thermodesulfobacteriota bacterium]|jgi:REP element-mobilizing transposase RayT
MSHGSGKGRRSIRLKDYDYSQPGAYFITICTKDRMCLFGKDLDGELRINNYGKIVLGFWNDLDHLYSNVRTDAFVVMPNHVHGIIMIEESVGAIHELPLQNRNDKMKRRQMLIPKMVGRFKMKSSKRINAVRDTPNMSVWQRNYHEHIIRDEGSLKRIREYIKNNPLTWNLDRENIDREGEDEFDAWFENNFKKINPRFLINADS